ncbi:MAG: FliM/FliN family flagellar motor switch protein [Candidatus Gastranaerophilales bacterium]|nr:FliM/FliN family flagellar motor switch protein [Candidatus Gastranaerophilales bacterium]
MTQNSAQENILNSKNIAKVANVEVTMCAELGRAKIQLKDAIEYDTGSIITLDKTNNDPIDIFVDDILIAKGKIVAIEDSYGIKIVEIIENNKNLEKQTNEQI